MTESCKYPPCDREASTKATGYCHTHYWRSRNSKPMSAPIKERLDPEVNFWAKVNKTTGCWNWEGYRSAEGYGIVMVDGKNRKAHRVSYKWEYGDLPEGIQVDHMCHNPSCVKPEHLRLATTALNSQNRSGPAAHSTSGYRGVSLHGGGKWQAYATINQKTKYLGLHDSAEAANAVVTAWRREHMPYSVMDQLERSS